jgi:hypothetical protein
MLVLAAREDVLDLGSGGCITGALTHEEYARYLQDAGVARDAELARRRSCGPQLAPGGGSQFAVTPSTADA